MAKRIEILISGFGGQGVVRVGQILGEAAVLQGLFTTMLISHGTETRGGYVRSQLVISDAVIDSPVVERPDWFLAFSKIAYQRFRGLCRAGSVVLFDPANLEPELGAGHQGLDAEGLALRELGNPVFANVIFLGFLSRHLPIDEAHFQKAMAHRLPAKALEANLKALALGRKLAG